MNGLPQVLADLLAGLGAEEAVLYRALPGSVPEIVCAVGTSAMPTRLPPLTDGDMTQLPVQQGHAALAAAEGAQGRFILAVRRPARFDQAQCRAVRATVRALALTHT
jgi:hypothetical protein